MTDRDDLLCRVRRANPAPSGQDLPAELADSRPPAAWLIEGKYAMAATTRPGSRRRWRGPAIATAAMAAALAVALPLWFGGLFGLANEGLMKLAGKTPKFTIEAMKALGSHRNISWAKARQELGYSPRPLEETIRDTLDWFDRSGITK